MSTPPRALALLLLLDLACLAVHVLHELGWVGGELWRLDRDRGLAEWVQYAKALAAAALLWRRGSPVARVWSALFAYLAADDLLRLHETLGGRWLGPALGLPRAYHTGQVVYAALVAGAFAAALASRWRTAGGADRRTTRELALAVLALGAIAVGFDFLWSAVLRTGNDALAVVVEEGGEHLALTFAVWTVVRGLRPGSRGPGPVGRGAAGDAPAAGG